MGSGKSIREKVGKYVTPFYKKIIKVKLTFALEQAIKVQRESGGTALLFL
jgi:hypothetical protein